MHIKIFIFLLFLVPAAVSGQNFTAYFTGNTTDVATSPQGGICLMGGATEDDNAMKWFLQRASGGDVLVLRASGSDGYNDYLYAQLDVVVNSVETIVCNNPTASYEPYIHQKIRQAEAIWFAGGDQWKYISYWRGTPVDSLINQAIEQRHIVIGGTSAGMAIQGQYYFSAQNGTVTSAAALANPYAAGVTVDSGAFVRNSALTTVITDTHFDNPDRRGRLAVFLSRIFTDYGIQGKAIACDEYTAVCIAPDGIARVFGGFPSYDDNAYFIQTNCELPQPAPENCMPGEALTWDLGGQALKVYRIKGTSDGSGTFNLQNWATGFNGDWLHWSIQNGNFAQQAGTELNCAPLSLASGPFSPDIRLYPNPASQVVRVTAPGSDIGKCAFRLLNMLGQPLPVTFRYISDQTMEADISPLQQGVYFLHISAADHPTLTRVLVRE